MKSRSILFASLGLMLAMSQAYAGGYKVIEVKSGASIRGVVSHGGGAAPNESAGGDGCPPEVSNTDLTVIDGRLANAVVYLDRVKEGKKFDPRFKATVADQLSCIFTPHITLVQEGGTVIFQNSDKVLHNVKTSSIKNGTFNEGVSAGQKLEKKFDRAEFVNVACSVHPWMRSHVVVMDSPYYCATNERGEYVINDIPAGKYKVKVWHASLANEKASAAVDGKSEKPNKKFKVKLKAGQNMVMNFAYAGGKTDYAPPAVTASPIAPKMTPAGAVSRGNAAVISETTTGTVTKPVEVKVTEPKAATPAKPVEPAKPKVEPAQPKVEKVEVAKPVKKAEPKVVEKPVAKTVETKVEVVKAPTPTAEPKVIVKTVVKEVVREKEHVEVPSVKPIQDPASVTIILMCMALIGAVAAPVLVRFGVNDSPLAQSKGSGH